MKLLNQFKNGIVHYEDFICQGKAGSITGYKLLVTCKFCKKRLKKHKKLTQI